MSSFATSLDEKQVAKSPFEQFQVWFDDAHQASIGQPEAMAVSTVSADLRPSVRIVLCKGFDHRGFVFYTNYGSAKAQALLVHPQTELLFFWEPLARQVRISGEAHQVSAEESNAYFATRPRGSQVGAWASPQSQVVANREAMLTAYQEAEARFSDEEEVTRPSHWGGFRVVPQRIEFWQGRDNRFHDRVCYTRSDVNGGSWEIVRLAP